MTKRLSFIANNQQSHVLPPRIFAVFGQGLLQCNGLIYWYSRRSSDIALVQMGSSTKSLSSRCQKDFNIRS